MKTMMAFALVALVGCAAFCRYSIIMTIAAASPGVLQGHEVLPEANRALWIAAAAVGVAVAMLFLRRGKRIVATAMDFPRRETAVVFPPVTRPS